MKKVTQTLVALVSVLLLSSCAVYMATNQPPKRNLAVLKPGTDRDVVIAELGAPVMSEKTDVGRKDIYTFVQGYSKLTKAGRALFHGTADLFTIGLWEAVGTPVEGAFDGKRISVRVLFDDHEKVISSTTLSVEDPKSGSPSPAMAPATNKSANP
jgi:outer membrane protein assembly factor BamE (lipoprotein component of BamABCDE complex)